MSFEGLNKERLDLGTKAKNVLTSICKSKNCKEQTRLIQSRLNETSQDIKTLETFLDSNDLLRSKRWDILGSIKSAAGVFGEEEGKKLKEAIEKLSSAQKKIETNVKTVQKSLKDLLTNAKETKAVEKLSQDVQDFSQKMASLMRTIISKRLNEGFITVQDVEETLKEAEVLMRSDFDDREIAFNAIECMQHLQLNYKFDEKKVLLLTIEVPVTEKENFSLERIIKMPTKVRNFVLLLNFDLEFLAIDSKNDFVIVENLTSCTETSKTIIICDQPAELFDENLKNCLSKMIIDRVAEFDLCSDFISVARLPATVLIENDAGEVWLHSNRSHRIDTRCEGNTTNQTVSENVLITSDEKCILKMSDPKIVVEISETTPENLLTTSVFVNASISLEIPDEIPAPVLGNNHVYDTKSLLRVSGKLKNCIVAHNFQLIMKDLESFRRSHLSC